MRVIVTLVALLFTAFAAVGADDSHKAQTGGIPRETYDKLLTFAKVDAKTRTEVLAILDQKAKALATFDSGHEMEVVGLDGQYRSGDQAKMAAAQQRYRQILSERYAIAKDYDAKALAKVPKQEQVRFEADILWNRLAQTFAKADLRADQIAQAKAACERALGTAPASRGNRTVDQVAYADIRERVLTQEQRNRMDGVRPEIDRNDIAARSTSRPGSGSLGGSLSGRDDDDDGNRPGFSGGDTTTRSSDKDSKDKGSTIRGGGSFGGGSFGGGKSGFRTGKDRDKDKDKKDDGGNFFGD